MICVGMNQIDIITVILNEDWTYKDKSEIIDEMKMNQ